MSKAKTKLSEWIQVVKNISEPPRVVGLSGPLEQHVLQNTKYCKYLLFSQRFVSIFCSTAKALIKLVGVPSASSIVYFMAAD